MHWFDIYILFIKWSRNFRVNCLIRREIKSIIDIFFNINTIILPWILFVDFNIFNSPNICPFFYLTEKNVIKSWSTIKCPDLLNCQNMLLRYRIDNNISSFFKDLLVNFVVPVIINNFLRFHPLFSKWKSN